jgi:hypothetical protein
MKKYKPISLRSVKTYPLAGRKSKVDERLMAKPYVKGSTLKEFINSLPDVLAASDLQDVAAAIVKAREGNHPVVLGMGAHPIKVGLSPVIIDLMERGILTALATNGAAIVHDFELLYAGHTSEDVGEALKDGSFGMARDTGKELNAAIKKGVKNGHGLGKSIGVAFGSKKEKPKGPSIFLKAHELEIPATVHVAIGTDIIHMHPSANGATIGEASHRDFKLLASVLSDLEGGVYINLGSAVLMPEVFLKALTVARNLGHKLDNITTVNMDFIQHYRVRENVLQRPTQWGGKSFALTGHHEIMLPLLAAMVIERLEEK